MSELFESAHYGDRGAFRRRLSKLGLDDFLGRYPIPVLVEWGWLVPKHRLVIPNDYFAWLNDPDGWNRRSGTEESITAAFAGLNGLLDGTWFLEDPCEPLWFLHPFSRPGSEIGRLLAEQGTFRVDAQALPTIKSPQGDVNAFNADLFHHWQGFALVDVIRCSDCITPILNTPHVEECAAGIVKVAACLKGQDPSDILSLEQRWGGLAELMTWMSYFHAFEGALNKRHLPSDQELELRREGSRLLAAHLGVTEQSLSDAIRYRLLKLSQEWRWANRAHNRWTRPAWPHLQREVLAAMRWLCCISGKYVNDYLDEWQSPGMGNSVCADLHDVLPYGFFEDRRAFLRFAPHYLKEHNVISLDHQRFEADKLKSVVDRNCNENYVFSSFVGAFRQLHDELTHQFDRNAPLDLRNRRPLDFFALLAIRAEVSLRYAIGGPSLATIRKQGLAEYIHFLARARHLLSDEALAYLQQTIGLHTRLHSTPSGGGISDLMALNPGFGAMQSHLIKSFLACCLARNYFAHHHYLDGILQSSEEGAFLVSGILVTVLSLLGEESTPEAISMATSLE